MDQLSLFGPVQLGLFDRPEDPVPWWRWGVLDDDWDALDLLHPGAIARMLDGEPARGWHEKVFTSWPVVA